MAATIDLLRSYREECLLPPIRKHDAELCSLAIALLEAAPAVEWPPEMSALIERATPTVDKTNRRALEKYTSEMYFEWVKLRDAVEDDVELAKNVIIDLPSPPELPIPAICDDGVARPVPADQDWCAKKSLETWKKPGILAWHLTATFHWRWPDNE